jgi:hypothetical protein
MPTVVFFQWFCRISITCFVLMKPDTNIFGFIVCVFEYYMNNLGRRFCTARITRLMLSLYKGDTCGHFKKMNGCHCYTLILDLKILTLFFFSCITSHLNCLWSITSSSAFYFNIVCKTHTEGYFGHFLCQNFFQSFKNLFESFQIVWISLHFNSMSKSILKLHLKSF